MAQGSLNAPKLSTKSFEPASPEIVLVTALVAAVATNSNTKMDTYFIKDSERILIPSSAFRLDAPCRTSSAEEKHPLQHQLKMFLLPWPGYLCCPTLLT